jgi:hypothetical protein
VILVEFVDVFSTFVVGMKGAVVIQMKSYTEPIPAWESPTRIWLAGSSCGYVQCCQ